jgi:hypothetical protein
MDHDCKCFTTSESVENDSFAKPLYGLTPVPGVRIPASPPPRCRKIAANLFQHTSFHIVRLIAIKRPLLVVSIEVGGAAWSCPYSEILPEYNAIPTTASIRRASSWSISRCVLMPPATATRRDVACRISFTIFIGIPPIKPSVSMCV